MADLAPGDLVWVSPDATVGRGQAGRRPAMVVSGEGYLAAVRDLAIVVPITSVDRGWPHHVRVSGGGLKAASWAMTEQVRAISRQRIARRAGRASDATLAGARVWIGDFLEL